jgi:phenylacetate-CoA ligase
MHADLENEYYVRWRHFLSDSESWNREQIAAYQLNEFRRVVSAVYKRAPGYRRLYEAAGVRPELIKTLADISCLPFVTKEMIRDDLEGFSIDLPDRTCTATSGSTGIPLRIYRDSIAFAKELASKAHQYARLGWVEGDAQFCLRGYRIEAVDGIEFRPEFNELRCSAYHLTPEFMERYRRAAEKHRPDWIKCYPSAGYVFARFLRDSHRHFPPVKGVLCASEELYDFQKKMLREVFDARVFSHYGHYELAALAGYCEFEDVYHVLPQYGYVELIGDDGRPVTEPGERGEIVATSFVNRATPCVRYRTQDYAVFKSWGCSACGRSYQVWERIDGRLQEFLVARTGQYVPLTGVVFPDRVFDHVASFQFVQKGNGRAVFQFVPRPTYSAVFAPDIQHGLVEGLGADFEVDLEPVGEIPRTGRAKERLVREISDE